jgi:hypothetical protein
MELREKTDMNKIYISILYTYDEVYAIGKTYEESRENVARGYRKLYKPNERTPDARHGTVKELEEYFGIHTHEIDTKKGYTW